MRRIVWCAHLFCLQLLLGACTPNAPTQQQEANDSSASQETPSSGGGTCSRIQAREHSLGEVLLQKLVPIETDVRASIQAIEDAPGDTTAKMRLVELHKNQVLPFTGVLDRIFEQTEPPPLDLAQAVSHLKATSPTADISVPEAQDYFRAIDTLRGSLHDLTAQAETATNQKKSPESRGPLAMFLGALGFGLRTFGELCVSTAESASLAELGGILLELLGSGL